MEPIREADVQTQPGKRLAEKTEKRGSKRPWMIAVVIAAVLVAAYLALCACVQFTPQAGLLWMMALVLERALSGYAVAAFPMAKNTGLAHTFATAADRTTVRRVLMVLAALLSAALIWLLGGDQWWLAYLRFISGE